MLGVSADRFAECVLRAIAQSQEDWRLDTTCSGISAFWPGSDDYTGYSCPHAAAWDATVGSSFPTDSNCVFSSDGAQREEHAGTTEEDTATARRRTLRTAQTAFTQPWGADGTVAVSPHSRSSS